MRILAQPARRSDKTVERHYQDTIASPVAFDQHADLLDAATLDALKRLFPDGTAAMWGVMPGKNDANLPEIRKMAPGAWVFFSGDKRLYLGGTVALTWRNKELAARLWGTDSETGDTWEYMYALSGTRGFDIPIEELRSLLDWKPTRNIMRFQAFKDSEADLLQSLLTLEPAQAAPPANEEAATQQAIADYTGPLERSAERAYRGEQAHLKRTLLPGPTGECALCGRVLPAAFLIAAHIKKRAACTDDEKRDLQNVAMLACLLGCDGLYERGFITVADGGQLAVSPLAASAPAVAQHLTDHLAGRVTSWWTPEREPYFAWHRAHTFRSALTA
ncbi:hypothetical protein OG905_00410 [Streptomyces sp. NBC_00322]|uniref:hypothetical protein n=1 Tax=Streptomyces sp. NBC_00322 TaxID=2975712 RepID=UPI002E287584|nr:hypothetical protein [Streptomyces sp. NBC_00322]